MHGIRTVAIQTDLFAIVKLKKLKSVEKVWIAKMIELKIANKITIL